MTGVTIMGSQIFRFFGVSRDSKWEDCLLNLVISSH